LNTYHLNKNKKILPIIIIGSLIIGGIIWNTYQKRQQQKFGEKTVAEIISFKKVGGRINQYRLRYEFEVDDKEYQGSELVQYFECASYKKTKPEFNIKTGKPKTDQSRH